MILATMLATHCRHVVPRRHFLALLRGAFLGRMLLVLAGLLRLAWSSRLFDRLRFWLLRKQEAGGRYERAD
jgi:hypothetical protein